MYGLYFLQLCFVTSIILWVPNSFKSIIVCIIIIIIIIINPYCPYDVAILYNVNVQFTALLF